MDTLFDVDNINQLLEMIRKEINAPVVVAQQSTLGGIQNVSVLIMISLDEKETWANGILQNSRYMRFHLHNDGTLEQFEKSYKLVKKFRKTKVKNQEDIFTKINVYLLLVG